MPYYAANGRAVFERGNGLAGPNPYDTDQASPAIYFHWLTWLLGFGVVKCGCDPGVLFVIVGAIGGFACSRLTYSLVEAILPKKNLTAPLFLLCMWGGGLLILGRAMVNIVKTGGPAGSMFAYDPGAGQWCMYWGRTLMYPTEAVYHALAAAIWLAVVKDRCRLAAGLAMVLAATHPFSGIQLLGMLGAWWVARLVFNFRRCDWVEGLMIAGTTVAFLSYYFVFLESSNPIERYANSGL